MEEKSEEISDWEWVGEDLTGSIEETGRVEEKEKRLYGYLQVVCLGNWYENWNFCQQIIDWYWWE